MCGAVIGSSAMIDRVREGLDARTRCWRASTGVRPAEGMPADRHSQAEMQCRWRRSERHQATKNGLETPPYCPPPTTRIRGMGRTSGTEVERNAGTGSEKTNFFRLLLHRLIREYIVRWRSQELMGKANVQILLGTRCSIKHTIPESLIAIHQQDLPQSPRLFGIYPATDVKLFNGLDQPLSSSWIQVHSCTVVPHMATRCRLRCPKGYVTMTGVSGLAMPCYKGMLDLQIHTVQFWSGVCSLNPTRPRPLPEVDFFSEFQRSF